jgi:hypothetical protein
MKQNLPIALALRGVSKRFDRPAVDALYLTVYGDRARGLGIVSRARGTALVAFGVLGAAWLISPSRA